jgi:hypothetical protein
MAGRLTRIGSCLSSVSSECPYGWKSSPQAASDPETYVTHNRILFYVSFTAVTL